MGIYIYIRNRVVYTRLGSDIYLEAAAAALTSSQRDCHIDRIYIEFGMSSHAAVLYIYNTQTVLVCVYIIIEGQRDITMLCWWVRDVVAAPIHSRYHATAEHVVDVNPFYFLSLYDVDDDTSRAK